MNLIIKWLFYTCWYGHRWNNKKGGFNRILSSHRGLPGEEIMKNPDGGWVRYHRYCKRCYHTQYLKRENDEGTKASWADMP